MNIPTVKMAVCSYNKTQKCLVLSSEFVGMPRQLYVDSHHTGRKVMFKAVVEGDPLFSMDGWDGEMCFYRPSERLFNVDYLKIHHEY